MLQKLFSVFHYVANSGSHSTQLLLLVMQPALNCPRLNALKDRLKLTLRFPPSSFPLCTVA